MTTPSNLSAPSYTVNDSSSTEQFFNNYYTKNYSVSANADDAILSYFEGITDTKESATALAAAVIYTALSQGIDPMSVLSQFTTMPKGELNTYLTVFLNLNRVGSSLLGLSNQPSTNKYVDRAILP